MTMKVSELMTRDVETVSPDVTLQEAARLMARIDAGVLPVVQGRQLIGILTDRDIAIRAVGAGKDPASTRVSEIMSPNVKFTYEEDEVDDVAETMAELQVRRLPVVDRNKGVIGIVSLAD